jgi:hypothetical protein
MQLQEFIDVAKFTEEVNENLEDITEAMRTQTARAAWYGICHSKAKKQKNKVELLVKAVDAKLTTKHRKILQDEAVKVAEEEGSKPERITVDMVKAAVALDPQMLNLQKIQLEADEIESICRVAMDAFRTRSSMIVSLGNLARDQLKTNVQIQSARQAVSGYDQRRQARGNAARPAARGGEAPE